MKTKIDNMELQRLRHAADAYFSVKHWIDVFLWNLAHGDPCCYDSEWGASCWFCDGTAVPGIEPGRPIEHSYTCEWVLLREQHYHLPLMDGHVMERLGPPPPPSYGPIEPLDHWLRRLSRRDAVEGEAAMARLLAAPRGGIRIIPPPKINF